MSSYKIFNSLYTIEYINQHYEEKIKNNASTGLDKISGRKFESQLDENIKIINKKVLSNGYKFTKYKQLLISKGESKIPRSISIPTIRDKLTLSILNKLLFDVYGNAAITKMPHSIINEIKTAISEKDNSNFYKYDSFIKLDIESYYKSINHDLLKKILRRKIRKKEIIDLIFSAITTPSVSLPITNRSFIQKKVEGVPEGLSISNALANIYFWDIDDKYTSIANIKYFRYVDDILILCKSDYIDSIYKDINSDLEFIKLKINNKEDRGTLKEGFEYLGYKLNVNLTTVRDSSVLKIEQSIERLFIDYIRSKDKNIKLLEWKLNLKITGFISNNNKYGWLFFFSQIDDKVLLSKLDWLVSKFCKRYNLDDSLSLKRFKRTKYDIDFRLHTTNYILNFDKYGIEDKSNILTRIYNQDTNELTENQIEIEFNKIIYSEIRNIEKDIQAFS
ncbi:Retron-type reverse transcriptase [Terrisporobacter glycolicus]|nr:Retron-type reverse transcriptase [Terrisporobacter glycolicus]